MNLYYLGPQGTHSHEAADRFKDLLLPKGQLVTCSTIPEAIDCAFDGMGADVACVPIENSIQGAVTPSWDVLTHRIIQAREEEKRSATQILAALTMPIHHYAIYLDGMDPEAVEEVRSHPQALAQCRNRMASRFPNARLTAVSSTAQAVQSIAEEGDVRTVAIGSLRAARRYSLHYDAHPVEDRAGNETRFALIGSVDLLGKPSANDGMDLNKLGADHSGLEKVVSLCLRGVTHQPGGLVGALKLFAERGLNLSRVESRPVGDQLGNYVFYVDVSMPKGDDDAEPMLASVQEDLVHQQTDVVVLGAYPVLRGTD